MSKLTEPQVIEIIRRLGEGEQQKAIAIDFGVSRSTVLEIAAGNLWSYLPRPDTIRTRRKPLSYKKRPHRRRRHGRVEMVFWDGTVGSDGLPIFNLDGGATNA